MTLRLQRDISTIKNTLLQMSSLVEEAVKSALLACQQQNPDLARLVIERDEEIDAIQMKIDEYVLEALALQQPMAVDLRFLTSAQQIAGQLERVGDHAVNLSEEIVHIMGKTGSVCILSPGLRDMANLAVSMLADSINAFVYGDSALAREVRMRDKRVDELYRHVFTEEITSMQQGGHEIVPGVYLIILALNIERIADLATNIAEDVIYLVEGRLVRHDESEVSDVHGKAKKEMDKEGICEKKGRPEPLECLERHAKYVCDALDHSMRAFTAYCDGDSEGFRLYLEKTRELEQAADLVKRNVRSHLPKGVIMPIDKFELFQYLNEQDDVANTAEDIMDWLSYRTVVIGESLKREYHRLYSQCINITGMLFDIIKDARAYFQVGDEEVRVRMKREIRRMRDEETKADGMEHRIKQIIFDTYAEDLFPVYFLVRLVELIGRTADHAVGAADVMRSMIAR
ncbi:MAG: phosphate signaling complex protein PhoU [Deltaproteobacteria bacterium]